MKHLAHESPIIIVTGNSEKAAEIENMTGWGFQAVDLRIPEIQSLDVVEVAAEKALSAYISLRRPVVVDDTGLYIEALGGLPGALVTWFLDRLGPNGILDLIRFTSDRRATVSTCLAIASAVGVKTFVGTIQGHLADRPRGTGGFGYDSIFIPNSHSKTYAEMDPSERVSCSMRMIALSKLKSHLDGFAPGDL